MFAFLCCMFPACLFLRETQIISFASEDSIFCTFLYAGAVYSCLCVWLYLRVSVCQTPVLHPLLHLVSQLHTRREKGLSVHVCTTHVSSPFTPHFCFFCCCFLLYEIISQTLIDEAKILKILCFCFLAYKNLYAISGAKPFTTYSDVTLVENIEIIYE